MDSPQNGSTLPEAVDEGQKPEGGDTLSALVFGALGVVYGDIGTSPLYSFREALRVAGSDGTVLREDVLGVLSLIVWALTLVVTVKYVTFVLRADAPTPAKKLEADLCWFDDEPLSPQRKYLLKQATSTVYVKVGNVDTVLDVSTLSHGTDKSTLAMNDIGRVQLSLQKPVAADTYDVNPATGAFVLIDEATHHTVAAGMIRELVA